MTEKDTETALAKITAEVLAYPYYNGKSLYNSVAAQRATVKSRLDALIAAQYKIKLPVKDNYAVIPKDVEVYSVLQDYGQCATNCLNVSEEEPNDSDYRLLNSFLNAVMLQAQKRGAEIISNERDAQSKAELDARFAEYIEDLNKRQKDLEAQAQDAQKRLSDLQNAATQVNESLNNAVNTANSITDKVNKAQKAANSARTKAKEAKNTAREVKTTADNMIPNMLAVLGILVGVVVAVVACYLTILLERKDAEAIAIVSIPLAFMFAWMMGHVLIMAVFLLLYMTAKLTGRTISCECQNYNGVQNQTMHECFKCSTQCKTVDKLRLRFPYIYWINVVFLAGYVVLGIIHIVDLYYADNLYQYFTDQPCIPICAMAVIAGILVGFIIIPERLWRKRNKNPQMQP